MPATASPRGAGEAQAIDWARVGSLAGAVALVYTALAFWYEWRVFGWISRDVVHSIAPALVALKQHVGSAYAQAFGRAYIIVLAGLAGLALLWPIRWLALSRRPCVVVAACAVSPILILNACLPRMSLLLFSTPHLLAFGVFVASVLRWPPRVRKRTSLP